MPLSPPSVSRQLLHTRCVQVQGYAREDGMLDIDAELTDVKSYDFEGHHGTHEAGKPVHALWLRLTVDEQYTIVAAEAAYDAAPYGAACSAIASAYQDLVGMNLLRGFRQQVKARFGRTAGCTHMTELSLVLPTAAVQSMSRQRRARAASSDQRPFQLDGCHALDVRGDVARHYYPRWYEPSASAPT